jgi:hypothetical protein
MGAVAIARDFANSKMRLYKNKSEEFVHDICSKTFLSLWSYPNPQGKRRGTELCDLLIVCDPDVVIFSVKEIQIKSQDPNKIELTRWSNKAIKSSVKQIYGAERALKALKQVTKADGTIGLYLPDPSSIRIHRIAIALGGKRKIYVHSGDFGKGHVHIFDDESFQIALKELDTISDFVEYLNAKTDLVSDAKLTIIEGGEEDLLAHYLKNNRQFNQNTGLVFIGEGIWKDFSNSVPYRARLDADKKSYLWDMLIETVAGFAVKEELLFGPNISEVESTLRYMAKETRFDRRILSDSFSDFLNNANQIDSRIVARDVGIIYCFLAKDMKISREVRKTELEVRSVLVKDMFPERPTVIGIATEKPSQKTGFSLDLCCIHMEKWSEEDHLRAVELKEKTGFFSDIRTSNSNTTEYPKEKN